MPINFDKNFRYQGVWGGSHHHFADNSLTKIQPEALVVPTARELRMLFTAQKEAPANAEQLSDLFLWKKVEGS